jgi:PAS domain-containing protein
MQIRTASGFAGLAVEMVSQAAERAGVQLRWVETGTSSDEAFEKGLVDLWPLMADLPDRRKRIHFTRPWLHSNFSLLHANSLSVDRNFTGLIAVFRMPLNVRLLREQFPHAQVDEFPEANDVVKAVCRGRAAAGFLEGRVALTALRDKPSECASVALRVQTLPDLSLQSSVASTFEAAGGADIIRREIGNMYRDGTLAAAMAKYSYYGLDNTWTSFDLMEAAERTRRRAWGIGALAMGVALALWLASFLHQRQRAEVMLRESEERFRATFFQAAVGIAQTSLQGEWLLLNNRFSEIVGYTQANCVCAPSWILRTQTTARQYRCAPPVSSRRSHRGRGENVISTRTVPPYGPGCISGFGINVYRLHSVVEDIPTESRRNTLWDTSGVPLWPRAQPPGHKGAGSALKLRFPENTPSFTAWPLTVLHFRMKSGSA